MQLITGRCIEIGFVDVVIRALILARRGVGGSSDAKVLVFHPVTSAWVGAYYCRSFLFVSGTSSPDRALHDFTGTLATIFSYCVVIG